MVVRTLVSSGTDLRRAASPPAGGIALGPSGNGSDSSSQTQRIFREPAQLCAHDRTHCSRWRCMAGVVLCLCLRRESQASWRISHLLRVL